MRDFFGLFMALVAFGGFGYFVYLKIIKKKMDRQLDGPFKPKTFKKLFERQAEEKSWVDSRTADDSTPTVTRPSDAEDKPQD